MSKTITDTRSTLSRQSAAPGIVVFAVTNVGRKTHDFSIVGKFSGFMERNLFNAFLLDASPLTAEFIVNEAVEPDQRVHLPPLLAVLGRRLPGDFIDDVAGV